MAAVPLAVVRGDDDEYKPDSVQKRASVHPKTVEEVSQQQEERRRRGRGPRKASKVVTRQKHPGLMLARALGVPEEHVQITAEGDRWGCIIWNHPAPWPEVKR